MTCALKVSMRHTDDAAKDRITDVCSEFQRRHKKTNKVIDLCGIDDKTMFCALGSRHFKTQGKDCRQWLPDIGISVSDALSINLNKRIIWLTYAILGLTIISTGFLILDASEKLKKVPPSVEHRYEPPPQQSSKDGQHENKNANNQNDLPQSEKGSPVRPGIVKPVPKINQ